jgi:hypothetical protein
MKRGRPPGMTSARILQRLIIAEAIVQGSKITALAQRIGRSRSWVSREANAPETRLMVSALIERQADTIVQMILEALTTLDDALDASELLRHYCPN